MARIKPERVEHALHSLNEWRKSVQDQGAKHILPLVALLEKGAGNLTATMFKESPDEYAFWDNYFKLRDEDQEKPYFNPVTLKRAERGFPHSNAATIRKNTFDLKWHAANRSQDAEGNDVWTLNKNYADIVREKVLQKGRNTTRFPIVDLAILLYRNLPFKDDARAADLETLYRQQFQQLEDDYRKIFEFRDELPEQIFGPDDTPDYEAAIKRALLPTSNDMATIVPLPQPPFKFETEDDPVLLEVQDILAIGTSGIILKGPPGTGKSYYAQRIANTLVVDPKLDVFRVQFHPSYGYEDFVEGYRPDNKAASGFQIVPKTFMNACERARAVKPNRVVVIVDEINRGDPARVFGELLTYLESDYRDIEFTLPFSGDPLRIPSNLLLVGTMNPNDRSVSFVDAAFVRRFDHIALEPSREIAEQLLEKSRGFTPDQIALIGSWFENAQKFIPFGLGHSFFAKIKNVDGLKIIWRYRIRPTAETSLDINEGAKVDFFRSYEALLRRLEGAIGGD